MTEIRRLSNSNHLVHWSMETA